MNYAKTVCCQLSEHVEKMIPNRNSLPAFDNAHDSRSSESLDSSISANYNFGGIDLLFQDFRQFIPDKDNLSISTPPAALFQEDLHAGNESAIDSAPLDYQFVDRVLSTALDSCRKLLLYNPTFVHHVLRAMAVIQAAFFEQLNPERWESTLQMPPIIDESRQISLLSSIERLATIYAMARKQIKSLSASDFSRDDHFLIVAYMNVWFRHILGVENSVGKTILDACQISIPSRYASSQTFKNFQERMRCDSSSKAHAWRIILTVLPSVCFFELAEPSFKDGSVVISKKHAIFAVTNEFLRLLALGDSSLPQSDRMAPDAVGRTFCEPKFDSPCFVLFRNMHLLFMLVHFSADSADSPPNITCNWSKFFDDNYRCSQLICKPILVGPDRFIFQCALHAVTDQSAFSPFSPGPSLGIVDPKFVFEFTSKSLDFNVKNLSQLSLTMILKYFSGENRLLELHEPRFRYCLLSSVFSQGTFPAQKLLDEEICIPSNSTTSSLGRFMSEAATAPHIMLDDVLEVCRQLNSLCVATSDGKGGLEKPAQEALKVILHLSVCVARVMTERDELRHLSQMLQLLKHINEFSDFLFECAQATSDGIVAKVHLFARSALGYAALLTLSSDLDAVAFRNFKRFVQASAFVLFWNESKNCFELPPAPSDIFREQPGFATPLCDFSGVPHTPLDLDDVFTSILQKEEYDDAVCDVAQ